MKKELALYPLQIITDDPEKYCDPNARVSSLSTPESLDSFMVNVIDLDSNSIWKNNSNSYESIIDHTKLENLKTMISKSTKTKIVFCYPYDLVFDRSSYKTSLRDIPSVVTSILSKKLGCILATLIYEKNETTINERKYQSIFYFDGHKEDSLISSDRSERTVMISASNKYYTTLHIDSYSDLILLLERIGLVKNKEKEPNWFDKYSFYNDDNLKKEYKEKERLKKEIEASIEDIEQEIENNRRFKSILYTNGNELELIVYEILEQIMECDLSGFKDIKKEDFLINKETITFIGEIKGVNSNVKNTFISQLDNNADERQEHHPEEKLKQLLIINDQKTTEPTLREPVSDEQITKANRNQCLIIRTPDLLKTFELFKQGKTSTKEIIEVFSNNSGLYSVDLLGI